MKKYIIFLLTVFCIAVSCKKEPGTGEMQFVTTFARSSDSIFYDSVSYSIINYSDAIEFKDTSEINNPEIFSHSIKLHINGFKTDYISLAVGHKYFIKKFDLVDKSDNVIFYIPYGNQDFYVNNIKYTTSGLPILFSVSSSTKSGIQLLITKK